MQGAATFWHLLRGVCCKLLCQFFRVIEFKQILTRPNLACSVAKNDRRFCSALIFHETISNKYRYQNPFKQETLWKVTLNLKKPSTWKTTYWSLPHAIKSAEFGTFPCHITLPNTCEFFGDKKWVTAKRFATFWDCILRTAQRIRFKKKRP